MRSRTNARMAAVQATFQLNFTTDTLSKVMDDFSSFHFKETRNSGKKETVDIKFFKLIVYGVFNKKEIIKDIISKGLNKNWKLKRIDPTMYALLELGIYELLYMDSIPKEIVLDEYVSIASNFFDNTQVGFVNGFLDNLPKKINDDEKYE